MLAEKFSSVSLLASCTTPPTCYYSVRHVRHVQNKPAEHSVGFGAADYLTIQPDLLDVPEFLEVPTYDFGLIFRIHGATEHLRASIKCQHSCLATCIGLVKLSNFQEVLTRVLFTRSIISAFLFFPSFFGIRGSTHNKQEGFQVMPYAIYYIFNAERSCIEDNTMT